MFSKVSRHNNGTEDLKHIDYLRALLFASYLENLEERFALIVIFKFKMLFAESVKVFFIEDERVNEILVHGFLKALIDIGRL